MAHDENNDCQVGDKVVIEEIRPISARKRFTLKEIVERAAISQEDLEVIKDKDEKPASKSKAKDSEVSEKAAKASTKKPAKTAKSVKEEEE